MAYCSQCGADCANATYCSQCGARVGLDSSTSSNEQNSNPYAVGAQASVHSGRNYDPEAPDIPGFGGAISTCFKKYCSFKGRASRSEYWYWTLFVFLVNFVLNFVVASDPEGNLAPLALLWSLVVFLPGISVCVRRLHDIDHSGWSFWIVLIPVVGAIILLVWYCRKGTPGENRFGLEPQKRG